MGDWSWPDFVPAHDQPVCVEGSECDVFGKLGKCRAGATRCYESGAIHCVELYAPAQETCNGDQDEDDEDCDGYPDSKDNEAHETCGAGNYCKAGTCTPGCWLHSHCAGTGKCYDGVCACATGPACTQPNPVCLGVVCGCDADSTCKTGEACQDGVCWCGAKTGAASGPFCSTGTCNPLTGACE